VATTVARTAGPRRRPRLAARLATTAVSLAGPDYYEANVVLAALAVHGDAVALVGMALICGGLVTLAALRLGWVDTFATGEALWSHLGTAPAAGVHYVTPPLGVAGVLPLETRRSGDTWES
jgi:hypothetical protein